MKSRTAPQSKAQIQSHEKMEMIYTGRAKTFSQNIWMIMHSNLPDNSGMKRKGAYVLYLDMPRALILNVGTLRSSFFTAGRYAYVGSASGGIDQRIARHRRLAHLKTGKVHWHIDYLLIHPDIKLTRQRAFPGCSECAISQKIASRQGVTIPVPKFGSTDCKAGCAAHLYRVRDRTELKNCLKHIHSIQSSLDGIGASFEQPEHKL